MRRATQSVSAMRQVGTGGWQSGQWGAARALTDHDVVVLVGDLNYRLSMPDEDARAALRKGDLQALRAADELTNMRTSGVLSPPPGLWFCGLQHLAQIVAAFQYTVHCARVGGLNFDSGLHGLQRRNPPCIATLHVDIWILTLQLTNHDCSQQTCSPCSVRQGALSRTGRRGRCPLHPRSSSSAGRPNTWVPKTSRARPLRQRPLTPTRCELVNRQVIDTIGTMLSGPLTHILAILSASCKLMLDVELNDPSSALVFVQVFHPLDEGYRR